MKGEIKFLRFLLTIYFYVFLQNHGSFNHYFYEINKSDSLYCICNKLSTLFHYILEGAVTTHFHVKKPSFLSSKV